MKPRPKTPPIRAVLEAAHWALIVFALMLAVLADGWAFYVTTPAKPLDRYVLERQSNEFIPE